MIGKLTEKVDALETVIESKNILLLQTAVVTANDKKPANSNTAIPNAMQKDRQNRNGVNKTNAQAINSVLIQNK